MAYGYQNLDPTTGEYIDKHTAVFYGSRGTVGLEGSGLPLLIDQVSPAWITDPSLTGGLPETFPTIGEQSPEGSMDIGGIIGTGLNIANQGLQIFSQAPPSGSDFLVKAYPLMLQQAKSTGLAVDAYWFGSIVRVLPTGSYGVMTSPPTLTDAEAWWNQQAASTKFYVLRCGGQGTPLLSGCRFDLMGASNAPAPGSTGTTTGGIQVGGIGMGGISMNTIIFMAVALVGAFVIFGGKK